MKFNGMANKLNLNIPNIHLKRNSSVNDSLKVKYISIGSCILYFIDKYRIIINH